MSLEDKPMRKNKKEEKSSDEEDKEEEEIIPKSPKKPPPPLKKPPVLLPVKEAPEKKEKSTKKRKNNFLPKINEEKNHADSEMSSMSEAFFEETKLNKVVSILAPTKLPESKYEDLNNELFTSAKPEAPPPTPIVAKPSSIKIRPNYKVLKVTGLEIDIPRIGPKKTKKKKSN